AQPISEEQFGDAETAVIGGHAQDALGVEFRGDDHIVLQVNAAFRGTGAAGGVEPERRVILAGVGRIQVRRVVSQQGGERMHAARSRADHNYVLQVAQTVGRNAMNLGQELLMDNGDAGTAVIQQEGVVVRLEQGVDGDGDGANFDGAKEAVGEFGSVEQKQQNAFFGANIQSQKSVAEAVNALLQLGVGDALLTTFDGDPGGAALAQVAVNKISGSVEIVRQTERGVGGMRHVSSLRDSALFLLPLPRTSVLGFSIASLRD